MGSWGSIRKPPYWGPLCGGLDAGREELVRRLEAVGYTYDEDKNRFL